MHANDFFYLPVVSIRLYELVWRSNRSVKYQTLECQSNELLFTIFLSDSADNELSELVKILVERSIFECNIQKNSSKIITIKKNIVTSKKRKCS